MHQNLRKTLGYLVTLSLQSTSSTLYVDSHCVVVTILKT